MTNEVENKIRPPIIAVIGVSKSGKTTIIEHLIRNLAKKNLRIGTIKHVHNPRHSLDLKGKDSWRHSQAGAKIVVCTSPKEIALFKKRENSRENIDEILQLFENEPVDLLLIEGFQSQVIQRSDIQKIVIVGDKGEFDALDKRLFPVLAFVGPTLLKKETPINLDAPYLSFLEDRNKLVELIKNLL
ncbi:MAG: molybdopterin-guanine dinucleotide biosynthesis protein B [Candidatus Bathyarchaeota archaeon]|nr:MAG: molybdopterin-guanine dinucleotide biosynthesis protein B [Candidatus Bathyarchaeota archaeon]